MKTEKFDCEITSNFDNPPEKGISHWTFFVVLPHPSVFAGSEITKSYEMYDIFAHESESTTCNRSHGKYGPHTYILFVFRFVNSVLPTNFFLLLLLLLSASLFPYVYSKFIVREIPLVWPIVAHGGQKKRMRWWWRVKLCHVHHMLCIRIGEMRLVQ